jgi:hypothetical protein
MLLDVPGIVVDEHCGREIVGEISLDAERVHELALDRLAQFTLAEQNRIVQSNASVNLMLDGPARKPSPVTVQSHDALFRFVKATREDERFRCIG